MRKTVPWGRLCPYSVCGTLESGWDPEGKQQSLHLRNSIESGYSSVGWWSYPTWQDCSTQGQEVDRDFYSHKY